MRLCWNDWFNGPLKDLTAKDAVELYDMGYRVVGINSGDADATDDDIKRVRDIVLGHGLQFGPYGSGGGAFHPDPATNRKNKDHLARAIQIAGKLGCTGVRFSVGSMHLTNVWMHHPENHTQKALDMCIESTRDLVPVAEDAECMLCPETTLWTIVNSVQRMKEYVDRLDSPYAKIVLDPVNHMTYDRVYESGRFVRCAIGTLGDRIGEIHVKDVMVQDLLLVSHIDETEMGTGLMDHAAIMQASNQLEPWKTFSLEHISDRSKVKPAYDYIQSVAMKTGHQWTDPACTRERWAKGMCK